MVGERISGANHRGTEDTEVLGRTSNIERRTSNFEREEPENTDRTDVPQVDTDGRES